ncbi:type IV pilin protein [Kineococcus indalonis]|uniref:type IV pilin protein n=1 Tax=Kineococcus indalonis TaxID=2696566 RepID=UPI00196AA10B|nr:prepilin-type N-terminal cleavage/methylation domain-containing protein [Kineococcus indalonis]NAZ84617.1 prepilin-type N-terminal cleavage/methylation domain-containing protein [Kineococcus indalonis]
MLARIRKAVEEKDQGFTLIELLVVMIIIGILAAIAIPTFLNQRNKAYDTQARSDLRSAQTEMETYYTDNQTYPTKLVAGTAPATGPAADTIYVKVSGKTAFATPTVTNTAGAESYCISAKSQSGSDFKIESGKSGVNKGTC